METLTGGEVGWTPVEPTVRLACPHLDGAVDSSGEEAPSGNGERCYTTLVSQQSLGADHVVHAPHPEGAVIGSAEHFGLVGGGDDGQSVNCPHMTCQGPHLLFRLNIPHVDEVFIGATDDVVVGDSNGVDAAPTGLQDMNTLQRTDVPNLDGLI